MTSYLESSIYSKCPKYLKLKQQDNTFPKQLKPVFLSIWTLKLRFSSTAELRQQLVIKLVVFLKTIPKTTQEVKVPRNHLAARRKSTFGCTMFRPKDPRVRRSLWRQKSRIRMSLMTSLILYSVEQCNYRYEIFEIAKHKCGTSKCTMGI